MADNPHEDTMGSVDLHCICPRPLVMMLGAGSQEPGTKDEPIKGVAAAPALEGQHQHGWAMVGLWRVGLALSR